MKNKVLIIIGALIVVGLGFFAATKFYQQERTTEVISKNENLVRDYSPRLGRAGASVQVVEFMDPECESCRMFHPYTKMLLTEFDGKVELVIRYAPFHGNSVFVIKVLEAARKQNRYWETLDILFQHQPEWGSHHNPRPDLIWNYLTEVGLNVDQVKKDLNDPATDTMIQQEITDGKALGVRMTPTFFINGKELQEFSYEALKAQVEAAL